MLYLLRCLRHYARARDWHEWLDGPLMARAASANPTLYRKIIRPYLNPSLSRAHALEVLQGHFRFVASRLDHTAFLQSCSPAGLALLHLPGLHGTSFSVHWVNDPKFSKEGELTLVLRDGQAGGVISSLTCVIVRRRSGHGHYLLIGGIQGADSGSDPHVIRETAKSLHGLRPKALLLFVAQEIAHAWQLQRVRATGNRTHISRHPDYALNRRRRPELSYDEFWLESGGRRRNDGYFDLPLRHMPRADVTIKSNKRALYHRRHALLDQLSEDLHARLAQIGSGISISLIPVHRPEVPAVSPQNTPEFPPALSVAEERSPGQPLQELRH